MSKKTDDFITGLQIAGGVILAGAAGRHASHLIDGRLEEARYNYGNYPGPPHDRERIGDYLLSLQKQAQKDFDACAALLDAWGSLPASVFEPAPAVDFTDWIVSGWSPESTTKSKTTPSKIDLKFPMRFLLKNQYMLKTL